MIKSVYFSGTGKTEDCIKKISKLFGENIDYIDVTSKSQRENNFEFNKDDIVIVGMPVYAGQIPAVERITDCIKGEDTPCIIIACYGNRHYDDSLAQMKNLLECRGFKVVGGAAVIIEHTFAESLGKNRPDENDMVELKVWANNVIEKIKKGDISSTDFPGNPNPESKKSIPVPKTINYEECIKCGTCYKECPVSDIKFDDKPEFKNENCINCMRCVSVCPKKCISYNCSPLTKRLVDNFSEPRKLELFV